MDYEYPFSRRVVWLAAVSGVVMLALAGLTFHNTVTGNQDYCRNTSSLILIVVGIVGVVGGFCLLVAGIAQAIAARSWTSLAVPFAGLALIAFGASWFYSFLADFTLRACD